MKEMILAYLPWIGMILTILLTIYLGKTSKDDAVTKALRWAVEKVADHYFKLDNTEKLKMAADLTYEYLPKWMRWFVKQKDLEDLVQKTYDVMKLYLKSKDKNIERAAVESALSLASSNTIEAVKTAYNGNFAVTGNDQLKQINLKSEQKFNEIWANAQYKTNFKDAKELFAELGIKKQF